MRCGLCDQPTPHGSTSRVWPKRSRWWLFECHTFSNNAICTSSCSVWPVPIKWMGGPVHRRTTAWPSGKPCFPPAHRPPSRELLQQGGQCQKWERELTCWQSSWFNNRRAWICFKSQGYSAAVWWAPMGVVQMLRSSRRRGPATETADKPAPCQAMCARGTKNGCTRIIRSAHTQMLHSGSSTRRATPSMLTIVQTWTRHSMSNRDGCDKHKSPLVELVVGRNEVSDKQNVMHHSWRSGRSITSRGGARRALYESTKRVCASGRSRGNVLLHMIKAYAEPLWLVKDTTWRNPIRNLEPSEIVFNTVPARPSSQSLALTAPRTRWRSYTLKLVPVPATIDLIAANRLCENKCQRDVWKQVEGNCKWCTRFRPGSKLNNKASMALWWPQQRPSSSMDVHQSGGACVSCPSQRHPSMQIKMAASARHATLCARRRESVKKGRWINNENREPVWALWATPVQVWHTHQPFGFLFAWLCEVARQSTCAIEARQSMSNSRCSRHDSGVSCSTTGSNPASQSGNGQWDSWHIVWPSDRMNGWKCCHGGANLTWCLLPLLWWLNLAKASTDETQMRCAVSGVRWQWDLCATKSKKLRRTIQPRSSWRFPAESGICSGPPRWWSTGMTRPSIMWQTCNVLKQML